MICKTLHRKLNLSNTNLRKVYRKREVSSDFRLRTSHFEIHRFRNRYFRIFSVIGSCIFTPNRRYLWFSPGTPASSTTKTGRQDIAEILLKVALSTINQNQIIIRVSLLILKIPPPLKKINKKSPKTTVKLSKKSRNKRRSYCFGLCEVRAYKHKCCYCFLPSLNMN